MKYLLIFVFQMTVSYSLIADSTEVCTYDDFGSETCRRELIDCSFSDDDKVVIEAFKGLDFPVSKRSTSKDSLLTVVVSDYDSTTSNQVLHTYGLGPCSAIVMYDDSCNYSSLLHYATSTPSIAMELLSKDHQSQCPSSKNVNGFWLLSEVQGQNEKMINVMQRMLICDFKTRYPNGNLKIMPSRKEKYETDSIFFRMKESGKIDILLERNDLIQEKKVLKSSLSF